MPEALRLIGECASPGIAFGPAHVAPPQGGPRGAVLTPRAEQEALRAAIEVAVAERAG